MASCFTALFPLLLVSLSQAMQNGDVRLVNGPSANIGRVEVYYDGVWGTICDDSWNLQDGDTICRQLGYEGAETVRYRATFGEGTGPIWIDQTHCEKTHQSILDCTHNGWGVHDCAHREDAGVECKRKVPQKPKELPIRLSCPDSSSCGSCKVCADKKFPDPKDCLPQRSVEGIVEAFYNGEWRPVSNDGWDMSSANVVCGELGFPLAMSIPTMDQLWCNWNDDCFGSGQGSGSLSNRECTANEEFRNRLKLSWLKGLECVGTENKLLSCFFESFGPLSTTSIANVATVRCGYVPHPDCSNSVLRYEVSAQNNNISMLSLSIRLVHFSYLNMLLYFLSIFSCVLSCTNLAWITEIERDTLPHYSSIHGYTYRFTAHGGALFPGREGWRPVSEESGGRLATFAGT